MRLAKTRGNGHSSQEWQNKIKRFNFSQRSDFILEYNYKKHTCFASLGQPEVIEMGLLQCWASAVKPCQIPSGRMQQQIKGKKKPQTTAKLFTVKTAAQRKVVKEKWARQLW